MLQHAGVLQQADDQSVETNGDSSSAEIGAPRNLRPYGIQGVGANTMQNEPERHRTECSQNEGKGPNERNEGGQDQGTGRA
jgi:hypothetical protein